MLMLLMKRTPRASHCLLFVIVLLTGVGLVGCSNKTSDRDITLVDYRDLLRMLADDSRSTLVVDVRNWDAYDAGHIAGAICIPLPELRPRDRLLAVADQIVVYGQSFESPLSPAAAKRLIADGYTHVYDFRGGLELWRDRGGPVQTIDHDATSADAEAGDEPSAAPAP